MVAGTWAAGRPREVVEGDVAGYDFYPGRERALAWIAAEGLEVVVEEYVHARDAWDTGTSCCGRLADPSRGRLPAQ